MSLSRPVTFKNSVAVEKRLLRSQPLTNTHFLFLIFCGTCDGLDVAWNAKINYISGGVIPQPLLKPKLVSNTRHWLIKTVIVVCYTEWPKSYFTHFSVYVVAIVSGDLCDTLYINISHITLPGLLKYKTLLFLQLLFINYLTLCTGGWAAIAPSV
jgi:hypothetical protein